MILIYGGLFFAGFYIALRITNRNMGKWELVWYAFVLFLLVVGLS